MDGVEYLLQEMYGLENKSKQKEPATNSSGEDESEGEEEEEEDLGAECVVCITDVRDTLLLPCRHLCLCASCGMYIVYMEHMSVHVQACSPSLSPPSFSSPSLAANLRYQSNNCPICRTPFRALLQVTALQPLDPTLPLDDDEVTGNPRVTKL